MSLAKLCCPNRQHYSASHLKYDLSIDLISMHLITFLGRFVATTSIVLRPWDHAVLAQFSTNRNGITSRRAPCSAAKNLYPSSFLVAQRLDIGIQRWSGIHRLVKWVEKNHSQDNRLKDHRWTRRPVCWNNCVLAKLSSIIFIYRNE